VTICRPWILIVFLTVFLPGALRAERSGDYAPDQVIVRFDKSTTLHEAVRQLNSPAFRVTEALVPTLDIFLVKLSGPISVAEAIKTLESNRLVRWVQADHVVQSRSIPNDREFPGQWAMNRPSDADIDAPEAWDVTTGGTDPAGHDIVVAVVDNGAKLTHLDLAPNIWTNSRETAGNGLDDDGNGYVDDVHGWNAYNNNGSIPVPNGSHGTHVAGIIGAVGNNDASVAGVNWHVKLMIVAASSNVTSVVARGYNYVLTEKNLWWLSNGLDGANVVATNSSFGVDTGRCESDSFPIWNDLYNAMGQAGILSAAATKNSPVDVDVVGDVPTGCASPFLISVTNSDSLDHCNSGAAWGRTTIDLAAPGTAILSTMNSGTGYMTGTSMASPHVAGTVALMHAAASPDFYSYYVAHHDSGALLLKQFILESVDPLAGFDTLTVSGGRLNLRKAVVAVHQFSLGTAHLLAPDGGETWTNGMPVMISWSSSGQIGDIKVELNRNYPAGNWETILPITVNDGEEEWQVAGPAAIAARIRVSSVMYPSVSDISDASFTILGPPLRIAHDPLGDLVTGTGTITAWAWQTGMGRDIGDVTMYYRLRGAEGFESLALQFTGNPTEYATPLDFLPSGSYEYYVQTSTVAGQPVSVPGSAPRELYSFDVGTLDGSIIAYDDGTAEAFNWSGSAEAIESQWAVKFGPVPVPFALFGSQFVASRCIPDTIHTPVNVLVYEADSVTGLPGTVIAKVTSGSVGNVIGGLTPGTHWAQVIFTSADGSPLTVNTPEFYIAVQNTREAQMEAFGRDTSSVDQHRSYRYEPCSDNWFAEWDAESGPNAFAGNRLIRAQGFSLVPPAVVIHRTGNTVLLNWNKSDAPRYRVYRASNMYDDFQFVKSTADTFFTVASTDTASTLMFYHVTAAAE
jgi:subtilisin family serine protease